MRVTKLSAGCPAPVAPLPSQVSPRSVTFSMARSATFSMAIDSTESGEAPELLRLWHGTRSIER